jgi:hypothetical protein
MGAMVVDAPPAVTWSTPRRFTVHTGPRVWMIENETDARVRT